MIQERRALFHQPLMGGQSVAGREFSGSEKSLLIGQEEKNVVRARAASGAVDDTG